jgi:hypothetical protein
MRSAISHSEAATSCLRERSGRGKGLMGKELKQKGSSLHGKLGYNTEADNELNAITRFTKSLIL